MNLDGMNLHSMKLRSMKLDSMKRDTNLEILPAKKLAPIASILILLGLSLGLSQAQTPPKKTDSVGEARNVQQELVRLETGFFEAWKTKDQNYLREHMSENGVFFGQDGTFSRDEELASQQTSAKSCTVDGYGLSDFGALPLANGAYLLIYKAEQYATCNGEKVPVHINGSSIYVLKAGRWQAIYRAQVPLRNQG